MDDNSKSMFLKVIGFLSLGLAGIFGTAPFIVMTGSNLSGGDGYLFAGFLALSACLGVAGSALLKQADKGKRG